MRPIKIMFAAVAAMCATAMYGDTLTVTNSAYAQMRATTNVVAGATAKQGATYPALAPQPLFWLDCSDRTDWVVNGYGQVAKIPSKPGSKLAGARYLTTNTNETDWTGWTTGQIANRPYLRTGQAELMGGEGRFLDFLPNGWRCGMVFNTNETYTTSVLTNFGTVLWVRGSNLNFLDQGMRKGGHLLGCTIDGVKDWMLGGNPVTGDEWNGVVNWNSRLANKDACDSLKNGRIWLDGLLGAPGLTSYNGHWEVMSLQCGDANGATLGIGVDVSSNSDISGGELIAEMIIYDTVLTREQIEPIEMYLQQKWFGRGRTGWNGDARLGVLVPYKESFKGEIAVASGETLEVSRVQGGAHSGAELEKTGAGTLALSGDGVKDYTGDLVVNAGTVEVGALRDAPTSVDGLADHLYAHFDPSVANSLETETTDKTYVNMWSNLVTTAESKTYNKQLLGLRPYVANKRPWYLADALGTGLGVVDFGWFVNEGVNSVHMSFSTSATAATGSGLNAASKLFNIQTVVLVMGTQGGGGHLFNSPCFARGDRNANSVRHSIFSDRAVGKFDKDNDWGPDITGREQRVWINGREWDESRGYESTGYQVVAFQTAGASFGKLMMEDQDGYSGGARIGEMLIWNRTLTDQEIRDAQAYLSAKWLKKATPGYRLADGTGAAAEIQNLSVPAGQTATIDVAEGRTVRVGKLDVQGTLVKTGKGELDVQSASGNVSVADGIIRMAAARDAANVDTYAVGATMHVDASDAKSLTTVARSDGASAVINWADKNNNVNLRNPGFKTDTSRTPHINAAELNGMDTVDFGYWGDSTALLPTHGGTWMFLDRPLHSMRAIYAVVKYHGRDASGNSPRLGFLFSNQAASTGVGQIGENDTTDFHPGNVSGQWTDDFMQTDRAELRDGCFTNGVNTIVSNFKVPLDEYFLLEMHPAVGYSGGVMGLDRTNTGRIGGFALGEVIVYEHPLSEREKVATRNYLLRKWFPGKALSPMPEAPTVEAFDGDLNFGATSTNTVAVTSAGRAEELLADVTGTISFESGATIRLTNLAAMGDFQGRKIVVAHADGGFSGLENLKITGDVEFTTMTQPSVTATPTGNLVVKLGQGGMVLIVW